ncbi:hypothetical protein EDD22DRAFT_773247 [Suillus occidentalis]|nr:hypothetical protein EDD22DRAFT_773247 [Suillus occidentalis]
MQDNHTEPQPNTDFKIWQQNLCKSSSTWEHMLQNLNPNTYDLKCIQEPFFNQIGLANTSNLRCYWDIIYPTNHHLNPERLQCILLVNKKLFKNNWHIIPLDSSNITVIELNGNFGKVRIYNIYNTCDHSCTL